MKRATGQLVICFGLMLTGCTIAPHGSRTTHTVWTYEGGQLVRKEKWTDRSAGGGLLLFMDPQLQNVAVSHTNSVLRVGGSMAIGSAYISVDTNTASVITAVGGAVGHMVGAAVRSAAG